MVLKPCVYWFLGFFRDSEKEKTGRVFCGPTSIGDGADLLGRCANMRRGHAESSFHAYELCAVLGMSPFRETRLLNQKKHKGSPLMRCRFPLADGGTRAPCELRSVDPEPLQSRRRSYIHPPKSMKLSRGRHDLDAPAQLVGWGCSVASLVAGEKFGFSVLDFFELMCVILHH
ncbi:hypothetical protein DAEQUDRAFT_237060 [Daedalea quercina L-15889]|uniref:Uncharacterized protein n=1 Tax=Daedalea quercina L-15889 TaxID=1314783 RepID=A0A165QWY9_9APHY|nr:hypothetical protein DAEQUDRAFT_237060 [Daedalea quercina L-15889]